jgi:hypothetical protein
VVLSVFGWPERSVRPHMSRPICYIMWWPWCWFLNTYTNRNGWRMGGFGQSVPVRVCKEEKKDFCKTMTDRGWSEWSFPPYGPYTSTWTHGDDSEDRKGSTWISCGGKTSVHPEWWSPGRVSRRLGVGADHVSKRLEREREGATGGSQQWASIHLIFSTGKVFVLHPGTP